MSTPPVRIQRDPLRRSHSVVARFRRRLGALVGQGSRRTRRAGRAALRESHREQGASESQFVLRHTGISARVQVGRLGRLTSIILYAKFSREFAGRKLSIRNKVRKGVVLLRKREGVVLLERVLRHVLAAYWTLHLLLACVGSGRGGIPRPPPSLAAEERVGHVLACGLCVDGCLPHGMPLRAEQSQVLADVGISECQLSVAMD